MERWMEMDKKELLELIEGYGDLMFELRGNIKDEYSEKYDEISDKIDIVFKKITEIIDKL